MRDAGIERVVPLRMGYPPSERQYHTRLGWWLMSNDRRGSAVIGAGALAVLVGDVVYAATRWHGSFPRAFGVSLGLLGVVALIALAARFIRPFGNSRRARGWTQRGVNVVLLFLLVMIIDVNDRAGGNFAGTIAGEVAGLAGGFALYTAIWLWVKRA